MNPQAEQLKDLIEAFLMSAPGDGWASSAEIRRRFDLRSDRVLRGVGNSPGLCSEFAISSDKGFKHVARASTREWLAFKHRMRNHAISEMVRTRNLDRLRAQMTRTIKRPAFTFEKDTNQGVML
jgi:hypothetical protein